MTAPSDGDFWPTRVHLDAESPLHRVKAATATGAKDVTRPRVVSLGVNNQPSYIEHY